MTTRHDPLLDERSEEWQAVERAIWPNGPASGSGSGVYAALKSRVIAALSEADLRPRRFGGLTRATAKGTDIDVDEWDRPLFVYSAHPEPTLPPPDLALIDGTPENKAWERSVFASHPEQTVLHDPETCVRCHGEAGANLIEATERIRGHHDRTLGHTPTSRIGYCAEPDGLSATYCEIGILLSVIRP